VDEQLVKQLLALNRDFYNKFASAFSETRSSAQTRLERIVAEIQNDTRVLDVGCGNGRLAQRLDHELRRVEYCGVDASPELIAIAKRHNAFLRYARTDFRIADLTQADWCAGFAKASFDTIVMLAVLHHVPSFDLRRRLMSDLYTLLKPNGQLVMTNWQFDRNDRQQKRIVAWAKVGIDEKNLEPGDALLAWRRGGVGYRYCHLISKSEVLQMADQTGFRVLRQFLADADLNLYSILQRI
jgi:2-polyprenyl-3-methyl-5-hydroxy-6-metoxy-1,4-benzoquinol methylase